jgi:hypothetical protein
MRIDLRFVCLVVMLVTLPLHAALTQRCYWGATPPVVAPHSVEVISTPVVLNFAGGGGLPLIAFVSYATSANLSSDSGGVLRVIDHNCNEVARYPDPSCLIGTGWTPDPAPVSGLAAADLDHDGKPEIVAVVGGTVANQHRQLVAFNLNGGCLAVKWISNLMALPANDFIAPSAPAIAQLDAKPPSAVNQSEIVIDNKIFNYDGTLRFTGYNAQGGSCGSCPRSRTSIVANLGGVVPQLITGRGLYRSASLYWTFNQLTQTAVSNSPLTYSALAELDPNSAGPEIVVTDTMQHRLWVLRSNGGTLASISIANSACGGPPMIGDIDGTAGSEIGVATCNAYKIYRYDPNTQTIQQVWSYATNDPSGQTTSTLFNSPTGPRVLYADGSKIYVFNVPNHTVMQTVSNSSATAFEGPIVASLDTPSPFPTCTLNRGSVIVVANDSAGGNFHGVRIFNDPDIPDVGSCWNEESFHVTNVDTIFGTIPVFETPSWAPASRARNTYRVQAW